MQKKRGGTKLEAGGVHGEKKVRENGSSRQEMALEIDKTLPFSPEVHKKRKLTPLRWAAWRQRLKVCGEIRGEESRKGDRKSKQSQLAWG